MEEVITSTTTAVITATASATNNAVSDLDWVAIGAIVNAIVGLFIFWYTVETRQTRKQLEAQYVAQQRRYEEEKRRASETHVVPIHWNTKFVNPIILTMLDLTNLGPGPARGIMIVAARQNDDDSYTYFLHGLPGLPVGKTETVRLEQIGEEHPALSDVNWINLPAEGTHKMTVQIYASTVEGEKMPMREYNIGIG